MVTLVVCCYCAAVIFLCAIVGAYMPKYLKSRSQTYGCQVAFQLGNIFSGGVMLSAGMVHLLADSADCSSRPFLLPGVLVDFPMPFFLGATGFMFTLTLDMLADMYLQQLAPQTSSLSDSLLGEGERLAQIQPQQVSFFSGVVLALALSVHSFLAGLALSVEKDAKQIFDIFIAILAHKGMAAYALGVALTNSKPSNKPFWIVVGFFCMSTPLGIFAGYIINQNLNGAVADSLKALAAGTFLYVAIMEVIPKELVQTQFRALKLLFLWLGFLLMSLLAVWT